MINVQRPMSHVLLYTYPGAFVTESGETLLEPIVAYQTWGTLNAEGSNAVLVCHALTGSADAADWWYGLFHEGGVLDLERQFVVCTNVLGGCYGSTGPLSVDPTTGELYSGSFPVVTIRDMVRLQQALMDHLGVTSIESALGASMGGMQVLEWSLMDSRLKSMVIIGTDAAHSAWAIGISEAQRQAIYTDPNWHEGYFHSYGVVPSSGLAAARMMGMIMYRSAHSFEERFGRQMQPGHDNLMKVASYLHYQGRKLVDRFDAVTYVRLTQAMDSHDIARGRGSVEQVLATIRIPTLIVGIDSDILYPTAEQLFMARHIQGSRYDEIHSPAGHDAFLIEFDQLDRIMRDFFQTVTPTHFHL
jgi:homoserine O-acetyltransferase/O-succinyltransferase